VYCEPNGEFPHNPEPLPEHLVDLSSRTVSENAHLGITVDPDVDRLALVCEDGSMFGEEYTLVAVADYVLSKTPGPTVSNLSSTRALRDITEEKYQQIYEAAAVGEVNVVEKMKSIGAVIGGEGNGGIIYPDSHYGRDALVGIALFLSLLAEKQIRASQLRNSYPAYVISKNKIELQAATDVDALLRHIAEKYKNEEVDLTDGVKIYWGKEWVHLRKSNTEPIIRIYSESSNAQDADRLAQRIVADIQSISN
jgi:phosphomannomutase